MSINDFLWLKNLDSKMPGFLRALLVKTKPGFVHYSLNGDLYNEDANWGLANGVFFLKTVYILGLEDEFKTEIKEILEFIKSFQRVDGTFSDVRINRLSLNRRLFNSVRHLNFQNIFGQQTILAETRQAMSVLYLHNEKPIYSYRGVPKNKIEIESYLPSLDWRHPWDAGSHFSHLLFFIFLSDFPQKNDLIDFAVNWINSTLEHKDGFWYKGAPDITEKINGAMKILTGLKMVNRLDGINAERLIDGALGSINDRQACDHFNLIYILKCCLDVKGADYRIDEIRKFVQDRLELYKAYYYPEIGGFSFNLHQANKYYYGAKITRGLDEPDIHGTVMFLWGLSLIVKILNIDSGLRELPIN